jgi:Tfp pilus assembly protein PilF
MVTRLRQKKLTIPQQFGMGHEKRGFLRPETIRKRRAFFFLLLVGFLWGCYAGSVKPLIHRPEFQRENLPVRILRVLVVTDGTYKEAEIEKFVAKCSMISQIQVGLKLAIWGWHPIRWEAERNDVQKMLVRMVEETWVKREDFDIAVGFTFFESMEGPDKLMLGVIDTFFWRYILVREIDPQVLLHELFHAFLPEKAHAQEWVMRGVKHPYGSEWYWLRPEERKEILQNKWRDFNLMPAHEKKGRLKSTKADFYSNIGWFHLSRDELPAAFFYFEKAIETEQNHADGFMGRGAAFIKMTQYDRAVRELTKAIELDSKEGRAYGLRGIVLGLMGRYVEALQDAEKAVDLCPQDGEVYWFRSVVHFSKKDYGRAWEDVDRARKLGFEVPREFLNELRKASRRRG